MPLIAPALAFFPPFLWMGLVKGVKDCPALICGVFLARKGVGLGRGLGPKLPEPAAAIMPGAGAVGRLVFPPE